MCRVRVIGCLTPNISSNKSSQSSQANHSSHPSRRIRSCQTTQSVINHQGPMSSADRPGLGCVFGLRGGFACVSYGMYTASGGLPNGRVPYEFDMDGFVFTLPNLALWIVGGSKTKRGHKLEHANPQTEPTGKFVASGRAGSAGCIGNIGPIYPGKPSAH